MDVAGLQVDELLVALTPSSNQTGETCSYPVMLPLSANRKVTDADFRRQVLQVLCRCTTRLLLFFSATARSEEELCAQHSLSFIVTFRLK